MSNNREKLITITQASEMLGVSKQTLRRFPAEVIQPLYTPKGHRRYKLTDIEKLQGKEDTKVNNSVAVYVRVSSQDQKQKGDLDRQKSRVLEHCVKNKCNVKYILDEVGSGLNDNRRKFQKLLELVTTKQVNKVVVEHRDRLTRFNFGVLKTLFSGFDVEVEVLEVELNKTFEEELVGDMISLMSSFSARLYGKRSNRNKKNENK
jgi:putative resolvase